MIILVLSIYAKQPALSKSLVKQSQWEKAKVYIQSAKPSFKKACDIVTDYSVEGALVKEESMHLQWLLHACKNPSRRGAFLYVSLPQPSKYRKEWGPTPQHLSDSLGFYDISSSETKNYEIITKVYGTGYAYDANNVENMFSEDPNDPNYYAIYKPSIRKVGNWIAFNTRYLKPKKGIFPASYETNSFTESHALVLVNCKNKQLTEAYEWKPGDDRAIQNAISDSTSIRTKRFNGWWMYDEVVLSFTLDQNPHFPVLWTNHRDDAQYDYICNQ